MRRPSRRPRIVEDLDLSRFVFAAEKPGFRARNVAAAAPRGRISLGFLGASALFVVIVALLQHH